MKQIKDILYICIAVIVTFSISKTYSQVTDKDGNVYKTVIIGNQEWMAENLNVEHYRNGDAILTIDEKNKTSAFETGAWCYYDNDSKNGNIYGKLYDWYTVNDLRGLAPEGWHIPSDEEWTQLIIFLGGEKIAAGKLKATTLWQSPNTSASNESGFTALPGGFLTYRQQFIAIGENAYFWSSTKSNDSHNMHAWSVGMQYNNSKITKYDDYKDAGFSIRCIKNIQ